MKRIIAIAATAICCMGNDMPAQAFWVDECAIIRDQYAQSQKMLAATGAEMERQWRRNTGESSNFQADMLATDRAMYEAMLSHNGCK
jgi:hypothetical protein